MIEDTHLDEDAQEALALEKVITREVRGEDGRLYRRHVEPYRSDVGGVIVTYKPQAEASVSRENNDKAKTGLQSDLDADDAIQSLTMGVAQIGVWTLDVDTLFIEWDQQFGAIVRLNDSSSRLTQSAFAEHIFDDDKARFEQSLAAVIGYGKPQDIELRFCPPGQETIWLQMRSARVERNDGAVIVGIIADITERKGDKERSEFMMRELDHRVKNLLAIILSIAEITARSNDDIDAYKTDFRGRLESMARTHDLLAQTQWAGSDLGSLIEGETHSLASKNVVSVKGPVLKISPAAAQSLAMFLHELTVNALKHGALSCDDGRIAVRWNIAPDQNSTLQLVWDETGGPKVSLPSKEGFGGKVIDRIIKRKLDAEVTTDWHATGMKLTALIPLANIAADPKRNVSAT